MSHLNSITLTGNLVRDPDLVPPKEDRPETAVARLRIASSRVRGSGENKVQETTFVNCVCFGSAAQTAAQYLRKGSHVGVTGRLETREWQTEDGQPRAELRVAVLQLHLMPGGQAAAPSDGDSDDVSVAAPPDGVDVPL